MSTMSPSFIPRFTTMLILIGASPAAAAASIPSSTFATGKVGVVHRAKRRVVERVEAHRDAREAGVAQAARLLREQRAVGRQRDVGDAGFREHRDQPLDVPAQQRLAAGEPDLRHAARDEQLRDARDLLERQQIGVRKEMIVGVEDIPRHAVDAAEVAAVGDRDPQVVQRPSARIGERAGRDGRPERGIAHERVELRPPRAGFEALRASVSGMIVAIRKRCSRRNEEGNR